MCHSGMYVLARSSAQGISLRATVQYFICKTPAGRPASVSDILASKLYSPCCWALQSWLWPRTKGIVKNSAEDVGRMQMAGQRGRLVTLHRFIVNLPKNCSVSMILLDLESVSTPFAAEVLAAISSPPLYTLRPQAHPTKMGQRR